MVQSQEKRIPIIVVVHSFNVIKYLVIVFSPQSVKIAEAFNFNFLKKEVSMDKKDRRDSTIPRHNNIHALYAEVRKELGENANYITRSRIYELIRAKQGEYKMCVKQIAYILNHTRVT